MKISKFKRIRDMKEHGGWVGNLPECDGDLFVKVRSAGNADAARIYAEATASMSEDDFKDDEVKRELNIRILTEAVLLDWHGLQDDDGDAVPYDPDTARELLSDPDNGDFLNAIAWASQRVAQRGHDTLEAAVKNSSPASDGN